jgi:hypothetical protein
MASAFIPDELSYTLPPIALIGEQSFVSFKPVEASPFRENQTFSIQVADTENFLAGDGMYLKYKMKLTGGGTTGTSVLSTVGLLAPIKEISFDCGGAQVESVREYANWNAVIKKRVTGERRQYLGETECFAANGDSLSGTANQLNNGRYCVHSIENSIGQTNKDIPLPFIRSGIRMRFTLGSFADVVKSTAGSFTGYEISEVELICKMIRPPQSYLKEAQAALEAGRRMTIPLTLTKHYQTVLNASTNQTVDVFCGPVTSLKSVTATMRQSANINSTSADAYVHTLDKLKQYSVQVGAKKYPQNFYVQTTNDSSLGAIDPTVLALAISPVSSHSAGFANNSAWTANTDNFIYYPFARDYANGVSVPDGKIGIELLFNSAPTTGNVVDVYLEVDALLSIGASDVIVSEKQL